ncbi:MAG: site-specific integrase [Clostridiales bacterium]|nr:site-specific integrase [Clostridiales bacterium]
MGVYKDKKTNKWNVYLYHKDWQGDRKRKMKRGFATKREAQEWEREFQMTQSDNLEMTFDSFVKLYEEDRRPRLRYNTWLIKEHMIRVKLLPFFGNMPLSAIESTDVIKWQNKMINYRDKSGNPYSDTYLKAINSQLTAIFNHAYRYYGLKKNPCSKVGSIGKNHAGEMQYWTHDEYSKFAEAIESDARVYYAFEVLYWCGLRVGELCALTYADIDFDKKTININKSCQRIKGKDIITGPKTAKSNRIIAMPAFLADELLTYMNMQYGPSEKERVFQTSKSFLSRRLKAGAEKAGVKKIRVHDIRHSHVSLLIEKGFTPVAIADRLGHESIETTFRYAHLFPNKQNEMAERLNEERERVR